MAKCECMENLAVFKGMTFRSYCLDMMEADVMGLRLRVLSKLYSRQIAPEITEKVRMVWMQIDV